MKLCCDYCQCKELEARQGAVKNGGLHGSDDSVEQLRAQLEEQVLQVFAYYLSLLLIYGLYELSVHLSVVCCVNEHGAQFINSA